MKRGYMPKSKSDDWCTPKRIVDAVWRAFQGPPDLDPCSNTKSIVGAKARVMLPSDGLSFDWGDDGSFIYVNPPFSKADEWCQRCMHEGASRRNIILLIKAAVDTARWYHYVSTARIVCFVHGRLTFLGAKGPAPFPVAVAAWNTPRFEEAFSSEGTLWTPK